MLLLSTKSVPPVDVQGSDLTVKYDATAETGERRADPLAGSDTRPAWVAERPDAANRRDTRRNGTRSYAALDLGTNNCRLLIAEPAHFGFRVVDAFSRIVRLGRRARARQPAERGGHRAHHRGLAGLPGQDGGQGCGAGPPRRHGGLPPRRERSGLHRSACETISISSWRWWTAGPKPSWP